MATSSNKPISAIKKTAGGYYTFSKVTPPAKQLQLDVAKEVYGCSIGPMPVQSFLDRFMPTSRRIKSKLKNVKSNFFHKIPTKGLEKDMCKSFVKIMNDSNLFPDLEFVDTFDNEDRESSCKFRPDGGVYSTGAGRVSPLEWRLLQFFIEWKVIKALDAFCTNTCLDDIFDGISDRATEIRGQVYSYAAKIMDEQHRQFLFSVTIMGDHARITRFDPSCMVVSDLIPYRTNPQLLLDFFLRYCSMSPVERGYDPTVSPTCDAEKALFWERVDDYLERVERCNLRKHPDVETLGNNIVKIQVNDAKKGVRWYLACKPDSIPVNYSPCSRLSRGFIATPAPPCVEGEDKDSSTCEAKQPESEKGKLFWIKDSWRSDTFEAEFSMYDHLRANNVPNLPAIYFAGDILVEKATQETLNDTLLSDPSTDSWRRPTGIIYHMIHYRILSELLIPLDEIKDARELLHVGRDILNTVATAYHKAGAYHRDVGKGNIMFPESRKSDGPWGLLIDWDHAKRINAISTRVQPALRTKTWQFASIELLFDPTKPHDIFDDLQSLLWFLLYMGLHFFKYTGDCALDIFDEFSEKTNEVLGRTSCGGHRKNSWLASPQVTFDCKPLQDFFTKYSVLHAQHRRELGNAKTSKSGERKLAAFRKRIEDNVYGLLAYFDTILNNPRSNWSDQEANTTRRMRLTANAEQKLIRKSQGEAIKKGDWLGGGRNKSSQLDKVPHTRTKSSGSAKKRRRESDDDDEYRPKFSAVAASEGNGWCGENGKTRLRVARVSRVPGASGVARTSSSRVLRSRPRTR